MTEPLRKQRRRRLAPLRPERLTPEQRALYQRIVGGPRGSGGAFALTDADGALTGPFNALLLAPAIGTAVQEVGSALRYASALPARLREMAILAVAARWDSEFERYAHERVGAQVGLAPEDLAALRRGDVPAGANATERVALSVVAHLLVDGDLDDASYARALGELGDGILLELVTLVGYYALLALQLRVYRVPAPSSDVDTDDSNDHTSF